MNKPEDIVMVFGNPITSEHPIGLAKLIKKIADHSLHLENWQVSYLDDENLTYNVLIKKNDGKNKTKD